MGFGTSLSAGGVFVDDATGAPLQPLAGGDELFFYAPTMNGSAGRLTTNGVDRWAFDAATPESLFFSARLPGRWGSIGCNVLWTKEGASAGNVVWQLKWRKTTFASSGIFVAKTAGTAQTVAVPASVGDRGYTQLLGGIIDTPPGTLLNDPNIVHFELTRVADDAGDTYAADASVVVVGVFRVGTWGAL